MLTEDFTIFSPDMNYARCLVMYMPSSPLGVYKPLTLLFDTNLELHVGK